MTTINLAEAGKNAGDPRVLEIYVGDCYRLGKSCGADVKRVVGGARLRTETELALIDSYVGDPKLRDKMVIIYDPLQDDEARSLQTVLLARYR